MTQMKKVVLILAFTAMLIVPTPGKAFVFAIPVLVEGAVVLVSSAEAAYAAIIAGGAYTIGREVIRQGGKYALKKGTSSYVKPMLAKNLAKNAGLNKSMLRDIKRSKIVFNPSHRPVAGKQLLYYIALQHGGKRYYKIGITQHSLKKRYSREYHSVQIEPVLMLEMSRRSAATIERAIKLGFFKDRVNNRSILAKDGGYTEVYGRDILEIDGLVLSAVKMME